MIRHVSPFLLKDKKKDLYPRVMSDGRKKDEQGCCGVFAYLYSDEARPVLLKKQLCSLLALLEEIRPPKKPIILPDSGRCHSF